jgi:RHS repeat-associated protein
VAGNCLRIVDTHRCLSGVADPVLFPIDSNGNLTAKTEGTDVWGYEWNANNELTRVTKNSIEQARFAYDPQGRRVEKVTGGVVTSYTYDGAAIVREVRGGTTLKYLHGHGSRLDEPLAVENGTAVAYFHADGLGSVVRMTDGVGAVTLSRRYDAWGNLELGESTSGYAFTGREWDFESGLYYYRARYYDPKLGRFLSEDPLGVRQLAHNAPAHLHAYADGNPVRNVDPTGLFTICVPIDKDEWTSTRNYPDKNWTLQYATVSPIFKPYATCYWAKAGTTVTWKHTMVRELCVTWCGDVSTRWTSRPNTKVSESQSDGSYATTYGIDTPNGVDCVDPDGRRSGPHDPITW